MRTGSPLFAKIRSDIAGVLWPAISNGQAAMLTAMLRQLEDSQWRARDELAAMQFRQLAILAVHCERYSPHFRRRLQRAGLTARDLGSAEGFVRLPVLRRRELQGTADLFCEEVPADHAPLRETRTSGSTGEPVTIRRTNVSNFDWMVFNLREEFWHPRDFSKGFCAIRGTIGNLVRSPDWGAPTTTLFRTGPALGIPIATDIDRQVELIAEFGPDSLLTLPSNLAALARACAGRGVALPNLRQIRTIGETLSPQVRAEVAAIFPAEIADNYSSQEIGYIACQCPDAPVHHVMETVMVEILDEAGAPCGAGETGRVIVTDLRNFATPLIRYDIGDYAQASGPCPCGRGLPSIARILGRERNLLRLPDGRRHWPVMGVDHFPVRDIAPIRQYQVIQLETDLLEVRLVSDAPLAPRQEEELRVLVQKAFGHPFKVVFAFFEAEIPRGLNGKFEEFICRVN